MIATLSALLIGRPLPAKVAELPRHQIEWSVADRMWICRLGGPGNAVVSSPDKWRLVEWLDRVERLRAANPTVR